MRSELVLVTIDERGLIRMKRLKKTGTYDQSKEKT